ncbi:Retrovirus-related Pol polyprotein from transposon RE2 [Vitis vinifera]|uniref:Retrovirus-related Pol polyprotein from transposon RE2 n=1 Tax=Vitis vinifera TaxID=29760 RepID=A0A438DZW5_VITVI|nr:Retrovirus-related Pol polyprotein from transposon RE2 [Vitis vinifera]
MHIAEREKLSYIQGKINPSKELEDGYEKWYAENQKVKRWLLMSMSPEIMKRYLCLPIAQEIWSALSKVVMKDPEDIAAYWKSIERQRVHIFLAGLDVRHASMKAKSDNLDTSAMWDHNLDQRKKDSKKTSIAIVAEIKTEANVAKKASALVATTDYGTNGNTTPVIGEGSLTPHRHNRAIPNNVQEALADSRWKATMNEEMKSLQKNETWELVECPPGKKPLGVVGSILMYGVRKAMSEGVQIEEVIVWVEAIPKSMVRRFTKSMRAFGYRQITENDPEERKALQNYLSREFEMKDLGHLKYFLRIEVSRSSEGIFLSQRKYALDLLQETGMLGCQPVDTPIEEGLKLCVEPNQVSTDKGRYQRLVGRLMYLAHTKPDLAYALSVVSQYMHNPGDQHMNAVMLDDRRSTFGYFTFLGGNLVTWKSYLSRWKALKEPRVSSRLTSKESKRYFQLSGGASSGLLGDIFRRGRFEATGEREKLAGSRDFGEWETSDRSGFRRDILRAV